MGITVESLRKARLSYSVVLRRALQKFAMDVRAVFCFFEGKDSPYYGPRIHQAFAGVESPVVEFMNCDGKLNVIALHAAISSNPAAAGLKALFFVDRDFDPNSEIADQDDIYVTEGYSVENFYTTESAFRRIVRSSLFGDQVYSPEEVRAEREATDLYLSCRKQFHEAIQLFNAWVWAHRNSSRAARLNLGNLRLTELIRLDAAASSISSTYTLDTLNARACAAQPVSREEVENGLLWLAGKDPAIHFRGKEEAGFLIAFLKSLVDRAAEGIWPFDKPRRCSLRLSGKDLVQDFSSFADTPMGLVRFLDRFMRQQWADAAC